MLLLVWLACTTQAPPAETTPSTGSRPTETTPTDADTVDDSTTIDDSASDTDVTDTAAPTDTGTETTTDTELDCGAIAPLPVAYTTYGWGPSFEDFTFLPDGRILAVIGGNLKAIDFGGSSTVLVPNLGDVRGTRLLPDGRAALAHIETGSVLLVDPFTGGREVLASGLVNPNGIAIGDDGRVYVATTERILRLDPADFSQEVVAEMNNRSFDGLSFSPDYSRLYFNEEAGRVHWVDFDGNGDPGPVQDGPSIPIGAFSLLDGMAVDACGNLYTAEMGSTIWRVSPSGNVETVAVISGIAILPALNFGPGTGGFDANVLYVGDFTGKMHALEVDVPGKWEPHLP